MYSRKLLSILVVATVAFRDCSGRRGDVAEPSARLDAVMCPHTHPHEIRPGR